MDGRVGFCWFQTFFLLTSFSGAECFFNNEKYRHSFEMLFFLGVQSFYIFKTAWNPQLTERGSCVNLISEPPKEDKMVASCLICKSSKRKRVIRMFMRIRQFWKTHPLGETFCEKLKKFERFSGAMNRGKTASNLPTTMEELLQAPQNQSKITS